MYEEDENVCNLPKVLTIEVHNSEKTGKFYIEFIEHTEVTNYNNGCWTDREICKDEFKTLLKLCYPEWDGEHQLTGGSGSGR